MAEIVQTSVSCQVVYADVEGECHMQLPIFIDALGSCHVSLSPDSDILDHEAGRVLTHICMGTCASEEETRQQCLRNSLERALSQDAGESAHKKWMADALQRLKSFDMNSSEAKVDPELDIRTVAFSALGSADALRRAILEQRHTATKEAEESKPKNVCFLTYKEQMTLLTSH